MRRHLRALLPGRNRSPGIEPMLRALLDAGCTGLAVLDAQDKLVAWNGEFAGLCGPLLPPREGLPLGHLLATEGREASLLALAGGQKVVISIAAEGAPRVEAERLPLPEPEPGAMLRLTRIEIRAPEQQASAARL